MICSHDGHEPPFYVNKTYPISTKVTPNSYAPQSASKNADTGSLASHAPLYFRN